MIAAIDWFPVALLGLGILTGAACVIIVVQAAVCRLIADCQQAERELIAEQQKTHHLKGRLEAAIYTANYNGALVMQLRLQLEQHDDRHDEGEEWKHADD